MNKIIVIGTQPACPRCKLLTEIVTKKAELIGIDAEIRHIAYTCDESAAIASTAGLVPGTAKDVSKRTGIEIKWANDFSAKETVDQISNLDTEIKQFEKLFKEVAVLDQRLRIFENKAKDAGILMTPVLVINGDIKHQGSVPSISDIEKWLSALL